MDGGELYGLRFLRPPGLAAGCSAARAGGSARGAAGVAGQACGALVLVVWLPGIRNYRRLDLVRRPSWSLVWPTPEVETSDFAGFLDPESVGVATGIAFLSALVSELWARVCRMRRPC